VEQRFFLVENPTWTLNAGQHAKRVGKQALVPLGSDVGHLVDGAALLVKLRATSGRISMDQAAALVHLRDEFYIKSQIISDALAASALDDRLIAMFVDGAPTDARIVIDLWPRSFPEEVEAAEPTIHLADYYGLPPAQIACVNGTREVQSLLRAASMRDQELYAAHAARFLDAPHILTPLFAHVMNLRSEDNVKFPIQLRKLAEQLRTLLIEHGKTVRIERVTHSHIDAWAAVQNRRIAFLDGGVARIPSIAHLEPMALRVGVYAVRPGVRTEERELWSMTPFVIGDMIDHERPVLDRTNRKRLQEAVRYVAEPLSGLAHLSKVPDTSMLFLHGPLINQFVTYDEDQPYFLPCLSREFLASFGITEEDVRRSVVDIPQDPASAKPLWNQFMAVYAYIMLRIERHDIPVIGVVERVAGRSVTTAVLHALRDDKAINDAYVKQVATILERYDITDDFLFGCVLQAGEYLSPIRVDKNLVRRARERWQPVVKQYPQMLATMLKCEDTRFPFRVECNGTAGRQYADVMQLLYHTARLLPNYAFPVGLDIADKFAKVPDWISRGISAEVSAIILRRAVKTGDARVVAQVRQFLARTPRDFFFRPGSDI
jgi:hypothetical protein